MSQEINSERYSFLEVNIGEDDEGENLVKVLESLLPASVQVLNLIQVKRKQMYSSERVQIFRFFSYELEKVGNSSKVMESSSKDWSDMNRPLFLVCLIATQYAVDDEKEFRYRMMYSRETPSPSDNILVQKFSQLVACSKEKRFMFATMDIRYAPFLEKSASLHNKTATIYPNWTMYLRKEKALQFSKELLKESSQKESIFTIRPLKLDHATIVNANWKFGNSDDDTAQHLRDQIEHSVSAGIFLNNETQKEDDLACWVISMPTGTINALHTRNDCRRKGYAELAMKYICLNLAKQDIFPLVEIEPESLASKTLMAKLGFELAFDAAWIYCKNV